MSKSLSDYYLIELNNWEQSIKFYIDEIKSLGNQMEEVILRNTIIDIAAKVEAHQVLLNEVLAKFGTIRDKINGQKEHLLSNISAVNDEIKIKGIITLQNDLRKQVQSAEKEYIDIKFYCYEFLSETMKK